MIKLCIHDWIDIIDISKFDKGINSLFEYKNCEFKQQICKKCKKKRIVKNNEVINKKL